MPNSDFLNVYNLLDALAAKNSTFPNLSKQKVQEIFPKTHYIQENYKNEWFENHWNPNSYV